MFGALDLHETYYKVSVYTCACMYDCVCTNVFVLDTLRHSKGIGTLTKKTKAPQITEEDKIRAAIEVKKNAIKSSVADLWRRLQVIIHTNLQSPTLSRR